MSDAAATSVPAGEAPQSAYELLKLPSSKDCGCCPRLGGDRSAAGSAPQLSERIAPSYSEWLERILPGNSKWQEEMAAKHRRIDNYSRDEDLVALANEHSKKEGDPCKIEKFRVQPAAQYAQHIDMLTHEAEEGKESDAKMEREAQDRINGVIAEFQALQIPALANNVKERKETAIAELQASSEKLGKIEGEGQIDELLEAAGENVAQMSATEHEKAFKRLHNETVVGHEDAIRKHGQMMSNDDLWKEAFSDALHKACQIQAELATAEQLQPQRAFAIKKIAADIVAGVQKSKEFNGQQLAACVAHKKELSTKLGKKRKEVNKLLLASQRAVEELTDLCTEIESASLEIHFGQENEKKDEVRHADAKQSLKSCEDACKQLTESSLQNKKDLEKRVATFMDSWKATMQPFVLEVASSLQVASGLFERGVQKKEDEFQYAEGNLNQSRSDLNAWKAKLESKEPPNKHEDMLYHHKVCAKEITEYENQMTTCQAKKQVFVEASNSVNSKWMALKTDASLGPLIEADAVCTTANEVAGNAFKNFPLWKIPKASVPADQPDGYPRASDGALVSQDALADMNRQLEESRKMQFQLQQALVELQLNKALSVGPASSSDGHPSASDGTLAKKDDMKEMHEKVENLEMKLQQALAEMQLAKVQSVGPASSSHGYPSASDGTLAKKASSVEASETAADVEAKDQMMADIQLQNRFGALSVGSGPPSEASWTVEGSPLALPDSVETYSIATAEDVP